MKRGRHEATAPSPLSRRGRAKVTRGNARAAGGNNTGVRRKTSFLLSRSFFLTPANFPGVPSAAAADPSAYFLHFQLFAPLPGRNGTSRRQPSSLRKDSYVVDVVATDRENKATPCPRFHLFFTAEKSSYTGGIKSRVNRGRSFAEICYGRARHFDNIANFSATLRMT